ncbi:MAG: hypothetical protein HC841_04220 [Verrucomicrobiae bacterium]|nr:hypothetical protein [Verrucomicrobiae bacterium]
MTLGHLVARAADKERFNTLQSYLDFADAFLDHTAGHLQARIVSRNEPHYQFWQFKKDGHYNVSRPVHSELMFTAGECAKQFRAFARLLKQLREPGVDSAENRRCLNRSVYTLQQSIGIALDALPSGRSNTARKITGDLFERLIRLLLVEAGVRCRSGNVRIPVEVEGQAAFHMSYQHDLVIEEGEVMKILGSVKTSSKDRLDKIFVDKFLFAKLTGSQVPHIAIFLNDVQRKNTADPRQYGINATFLPGHFKGYTVKLNPLDGVYYCDLRPNMQSDPLLRRYIRSFDHLLFDDLWRLLSQPVQVAKVV